MKKLPITKIFLVIIAGLLILGFLYFFTIEVQKRREIAALEKIGVNELVDNINTLKKYLSNLGIERLMAKLVLESNGGSAFDCHQQAHRIGRMGYDLNGEKVFAQCDASCHSGCYHGAVESFLHKNGTANVSENIKRICRTFDTSFGIFECLHGIGHGVLAYFNYNLPDALLECDELNDTFSKSSCYGGVFMENILTGQGLGASDKNHATNWVNKTDPYFPCNKIDQTYEIQYQCYQMQTSWMLTLVGHDFELVAEQCLKAPKEMVSVCFKSLGRDISGYTLRDPHKILGLCGKVPEDHFNDCLIGAVNVIVDFWGPELKNQATELCSIAKEGSKKACYETMAGRIKEIYKDAKQQADACRSMESSYQYLCSDN